MGLLDSLLATATGAIKGGNGLVDYLNRGIKECGTVDVSALVQNSFHVNTILSGSSPQIRDHVVSKFVPLILNSRLPVVALYTTGSQIPMHIKNQCNGRFVFNIVNQASQNFAPFLGVDSDDAIDILLESAPEKFAINPNARYYLEAVTDIMNARKMRTSFAGYLKCPHNALVGKVDDLQMSGTLTDYDAQAIKSKLMIGQSESFKIDTYLKTLGKQMGNAMWNKNAGRKEIGIVPIIRQGGCIAIDIGPNCCSAYVDFLVEILKHISLQGMRYSLVIDSMNVAENKRLKELVSAPLAGTNYIISCNDLVSSCSGENSLIDNVLGAVEQFFIFSHPSGTSSRRWADVIGEYEKTERQRTTNRGKTWSSDPFDYEPSKNESTSTTVIKKRDYVVPPEQISNMAANEFYYKVKGVRGVSHCRIG